MLHALVRPFGPELARCELTHLARSPLDPERAAEQHAGYRRALEELGCRLVELTRLPDHPDAVFVEDPALVLEDLALLLRPGAPSRRGEVDSVGEALAPFRRCERLQAPDEATLEGGDVVRLEDTLLVGWSSRTNHAGLRALAHGVLREGLRVKAVEVRGCLHLKTACTALDPETLLAHGPWVDLHRVPEARVLQVPEGEATGANVLRVGETLLVAAHAPRTAELLDREGYRVRPVEIDELAKAEAGLTCMSLVFDA